MVVGATPSAGTLSEYELAALDMFILFNIPVGGHSYRLSPLEGFTWFGYHLGGSIYSTDHQQHFRIGAGAGLTRPGV